MSDTRRRVKLYALNADRQWDDRGTGHVTSLYIDRLKGQSLLVQAENDGSVLLESLILADTAYQKQQETLIVWSEGDNYDLALSFQEKIGCDEIWEKICNVQGKDPSVDLTQEILDDDDERYDDGNGTTLNNTNNNTNNNSNSGLSSIELPECSIDKLEEINEVIQSCLAYNIKREKVALQLETHSYIQKLIKIFKELEMIYNGEKQDDDEENDDDESTKTEQQEQQEQEQEKQEQQEQQEEQQESIVASTSANQETTTTTRELLTKETALNKLHKLYEIVKNIFLLNKNPIFELMLSDDNLWSIIGILEYDPQYFKQNETKKDHRNYLQNISQFKQIIKFNSLELINKIHQTYRVQYIQDVILPCPSVFEENVLSTLSSFIFFNKVEIVSMIQEDETFLKQLFNELNQTIDNQQSTVDKRRDLMLFLKEFCQFSQTLQPQNRESFFKSLSSYNILATIQFNIQFNDFIIKQSTIDILTYCVEYSPSFVREFILQQQQQQHDNNNDDNITLLIRIIEELISNLNNKLGFEFATQLSSIIKLLLDPENMITASVVNKSEKTDFLNYFYKNCMSLLISPIVDATKELQQQQQQQQQQPQPQPQQPQQQQQQHIIDDDSLIINSESMSSLLSQIIELITFCVEHHVYHIRNYIITNSLIHKILLLCQYTKHKFLSLTAIRFLRKIIGLKDEFYNRHIILNNSLKSIVEILFKNSGRYNLLDSAIIELFEFIKNEEIKSLNQYLWDKFGKQLDDINYVKTFKTLKLQYYHYINTNNNNNQNSGQQQTTMVTSGQFGHSNDDMTQNNNTTTTIHQSIMTQQQQQQSNRYRRDPRQLDEDEEMWFNDDDDDDEDDLDDDNDAMIDPIGSYKLDEQFEEFNKKIIEKKNSDNSSEKPRNPFNNQQQLSSTTAVTTTSTTTTTTTTTCLKRSLVDYPDDEDSDSDDDDDDNDSRDSNEDSNEDSSSNDDSTMNDTTNESKHQTTTTTTKRIRFS